MRHYLLMTNKRNKNGLTFGEWLAVAGVSAVVENRDAWLRGECPEDHRKAWAG